MGVNYRTVKHHIDVLVKNELVSSSKAGGYGEVYFLTTEMESNMALFNGLVKSLSNITAAPGFFQNILEQSNLSVIIIDDRGEILFWNLASEELFGYSEEDVLGKTNPLFPDDTVKADFLQRADAGEQIASHECQMQHSSGSPLDVSLTMDCIRDENNELVGYSIVSMDLSEQKRIEDELRANEQKYKGVLVDCCPEKVEDIEGTEEPKVVEPRSPEPEGPSCPVNYADKKSNEKPKSCCGDGGDCSD